MPAIVKNEDVEKTLRELLRADGYQLSKAKAYGQTGVDMLTSKEGETIHIEVIGYKSSRSTQAKDFFEVFFRAVSRLDDGATHCVIALANQSEVGLPARANHYKVAWERIGKTFPELEIWIVDVANKKYKRTSWIQWLDTAKE